MFVAALLTGFDEPALECGRFSDSGTMDGPLVFVATRGILLPLVDLLCLESVAELPLPLALALRKYDQYRENIELSVGNGRFRDVSGSHEGIFSNFL